MKSTTIAKHFSLLLFASFIYAAVAAQNFGNTRIDGTFHMTGNGVGNQNYDFRINDLTTDGGRFFVGANGNVGIGTNIPISRLTIASGNVFLQNGFVLASSNALLSSYAVSKLGTVSDVNGIYSGWVGTITPSSQFVIGAASLKTMYFTTEDKVGIGTSSPVHKLDVNGKGRYTVGTDASGNKINFDISKSTGDEAWVGTGSSHKLILGANNNGAMTIDVTGNIGMGITAPSAKLHVVGTSNFTGVVNIPKTGAYLQLGSDVPDREISAGQIAYQRHSDGLDILGAGTTGVNGTPRKITLIAEGGVQLWGSSFLQLGYNVGGREASAGKIAYNNTGLEIYGGGTTVANRKINFFAAGGSNFASADVNSTSMYFWIGNNTPNNGSWIGTTTNHSLTLGANNKDAMMISTDGEVGIGTGTSAPSAKLHVKGGNLIMEKSGMQLEMNSTMAGNGWFGTATNHALNIATNNKIRVTIKADGNIFMGFDDATLPIPTPSQTVLDNYDLFVHKGVLSEDFALAPVAEWADYVFEKNYKLKPLSDVERFINANQHLPGIPSAAEVKKDGYSVKDINIKFLEKIEELTLYTIEQEKKINGQEKKINELEKQVKQYEQLAAEVEKLKQAIK